MQCQRVVSVAAEHVARQPRNVRAIGELENTCVLEAFFVFGVHAIRGVVSLFPATLAMRAAERCAKACACTSGSQTQHR